jgi:hypothetical protein
MSTGHPCWADYTVILVKIVKSRRCDHIGACREADSLASGDSIPFHPGWILEDTEWHSIYFVGSHRLGLKILTVSVRRQGLVALDDRE